MYRIWSFFTKGCRVRPSPGTSSSQSSAQASLQTEDSENVVRLSENDKVYSFDSILKNGLENEKKWSSFVLLRNENNTLTWQKGQRTYQNYNFHNSYTGRNCKDSMFLGAASALLLSQLVRIVIGVVTERNLKKRHVTDLSSLYQKRLSAFRPLTVHSILPKVPLLPSVSFHSTAYAAGESENSVVNTLPKSSNSSTSPNKVSYEEDMEEFYTSTKKCLGMTYNIEGIKNYKNGKYRNAFQLFKLGSAGGSMQAQFNLAICYQQGKGTKQNIKQAKKEFNRAAMQGHRVAQYNLALILLEEKSVASITRGLRLLEKAAENGMVEAQTLGGSYLAQEGIHKNMKKAVKLFQLAAEQEDPLSTYHLAECYEHGLGGLKVDTCKAFDLYTSAASLGHLEAQYKMAMILFNGCPEIEKDEELALELFKQAQESGHDKSTLMVSKIERQRRLSKCFEETSVCKVETDAFSVDLSRFLRGWLNKLIPPSSSHARDTENASLPSFSDFPVVNLSIGRHFAPLGLHRVSSWPSSSLHTNPATVSHSVKPT